jgi:hypothetical protein
MANESHSPVIAILDKAEADAFLEIKAMMASIRAKKAEIADFRRAKAVLMGGAVANAKPSRPAEIAPKHPMPVGEAIVEAVGAGQKSPTGIFKYLADELGVHTTLGSVRARLSPLKSEGKISHDGDGWVPVGQSRPNPSDGGM